MTLSVAQVSGGPDDTCGAMGFFREKKCSAKSDEKIVCSANCKKINVCSQNCQKYGVIWGDLLVPLPKRKKMFVSGWEREKEVCTGEETIGSPPPHLSSGPPLRDICLKGRPIVQDLVRPTEGLFARGFWTPRPECSICSIRPT